MAIEVPYKKLKILVVEDDSTSREYLSRILESLGNVDSCIDGNEAIDAFESSLNSDSPFDLVCLDIDIPGVSGMDVLSRIRLDESGFGKEGIFRTKIIMTTASSGEEDVLGAYMHQCDAYCVKPIKKEDLFNKITEIGLIKVKKSLL